MYSGSTNWSPDLCHYKQQKYSHNPNVFTSRIILFIMGFLGLKSKSQEKNLENSGTDFVASM